VNTVEDDVLITLKSCSELAEEELQMLDPDFNLTQEEASAVYTAMVNSCETSRARKTKGLSSN
jgi:hypothetical protein